MPDLPIQNQYPKLRYYKSNFLAKIMNPLIKLSDIQYHIIQPLVYISKYVVLFANKLLRYRIKHESKINIKIVFLSFSLILNDFNKKISK